MQIQVSVGEPMTMGGRFNVVNHKNNEAYPPLMPITYSCGIYSCHERDSGDRNASVKVPFRSVWRTFHEQAQ
jgi:hypothetical protein